MPRMDPVPAKTFDYDPDAMILNLFYEDKDDRWFPGDRHLRRMARKMLFGEPRMSGQLRVFLNLCAGLDRLGIRYRVNDYGYIAQHPEEVACIIGRTFLLDKFAWKNPILLGVSAHNHPFDDPDLFKRLPVRKVVVPGPWYAEMYRPHWPETEAWPVGIDTDLWAPSRPGEKNVDVLLYDKVSWDRERYVPELVEPVRARLIKEGRSFTELRYGSYKEEDYQAALRTFARDDLPVPEREPGHRLSAGAVLRRAGVRLGSRRPLAGSRLLSAPGAVRAGVVGALLG